MGVLFILFALFALTNALIYREKIDQCDPVICMKIKSICASGFRKPTQPHCISPNEVIHTHTTHVKYYYISSPHLLRIVNPKTYMYNSYSYTWSYLVDFWNFYEDSIILRKSAKTTGHIFAIFSTKDEVYLVKFRGEDIPLFIGSTTSHPTLPRTTPKSTSIISTISSTMPTSTDISKSTSTRATYPSTHRSTTTTFSSLSPTTQSSTLEISTTKTTTIIVKTSIDIVVGGIFAFIVFIMLLLLFARKKYIQRINCMKMSILPRETTSVSENEDGFILDHRNITIHENDQDNGTCNDNFEWDNFVEIRL